MTGSTTSRIRDVSDLVTKGTTPTTIGRRFTSSGVRFIKVETIASNGRFIPGREAYIDFATHEILRRSQLAAGDILLSIAGALGRSTMVEEAWLPANTNQAFAIIRPSTRRRVVDPRYLLWQLRGAKVAKHVADINVQAAQANLSLEQVRDIEIPVVALPEQRAIAAALDDADDLIAALERMIAKKQAVKQGMMQQLLTGKTRIPGFVEPWREVRLGDHVTYARTVALSRAQLDRTAPLRYLHYGDIHTRTGLYLDAEREAMPRADAQLARNADRLQIGDLVFADASEDAAGVGKAVEIVGVPTDGVVAGLHTIAARFDKSFLADGYKAYLQFIPEFRYALLRLAAGTKVLATTRGYISGITLALPPVAEQIAIASVFRSVDAEINLLYSRLTKAGAIRQGMMQELLSGRTCLPVGEVAS